jgi:hypothetical protein
VKDTDNKSKTEQIRLHENSKICTSKDSIKGCECDLLLKHLLSMCEVVSSIPNTKKTINRVKRHHTKQGKIFVNYISGIYPEYVDNS